MPTKQILTIVIMAAIVVAALLFLRGEEDAWVCQEGEWVRHGKPSTPKPEESCPGVETDNELEKVNLIKIDSPRPNEEIASPLVVSGEARGYWFFEASFPVVLEDGAGNVLAFGIAQAQDEWMTEDFVPFEARLEFENPGQGKGRLVLKKDNPSGLPENDDELWLPIKFKEFGESEEQEETMVVKVFFNNENFDPEASCNKVFAVERQVPKTQAPARAAMEELLKGATQNDKDAGYFTSINPGVKIQKLTIENGLAKIDFDEQMEYQMGGSCRVSAIRAQITETLKQFPTVQSVVISVNGRTEDILQP